MRRALLLAMFPLWCACAHADEDPGTTIMGDRDSALGLVLAPWKDEARAPDLDRPPAMQDAAVAPLDDAAFARTTRYYATGRAYRSEKLQRNR
jgi:hypothetical protein